MHRALASSFALSLLVACAPEPPEAASSLDCSLPTFDDAPESDGYVVQVFRTVGPDEDPVDPVELDGSGVGVDEVFGPSITLSDGSFVLSLVEVTLEEGSQCPGSMEQSYRTDLVPAAELPAPGLTLDEVTDERIAGRFTGAFEDPMDGTIYVFEGAFAQSTLDTGLVGSR